MTEYDNPNKVKRKALLIKISERQHLSDIGFVMSTPEGRRVVNDLLKRCGVGRLSMASVANTDGIGSALQTAFYEGQRNIGNYYWSAITKNFKKEWLLMTEEAEKRTEESNGRSNSNENGRDSGNDDPNDQGA